MRADAVSGRGSPAGAGRPAVAVVVPIGSADDLARMGAALAQIRRVQGDEVVVVDNTRQQRLATPSGRGVLVRAPLERSSYYARNVGAAATSASWLLFIDSDCEPRPDLLERYFDPDPASDVGIVAGDVRAADAGHSLAERWGRSRRLLNVEYHLHRGPHPAGATANLLVSRRCWEALGGFQEGLRSAADLEFCWRAQDAGFGFEFRPGATVTHSNPDSIRRLLAKARRYGAGQLWVDRRYPGASPRPALFREWGRALGGALVWAVRGRGERAAFKLIDGAWAGALVAGRLVRSNRAHRLGADAERGDHPLLVMANGFPAASETFIRSELDALGKEGWGVRVETQVRPSRPDIDARRSYQPLYLEDETPAAKLANLAWLVVRHPWRAVADLRSRRRWRREEEVWSLAGLAPTARRIARRGERHIHVHFAASAALNAMRLARIMGITYSVEAHGYDIYAEPTNLREKLSTAAFASGTCHYTAEHLRELVGPAHAGRIHEIVMGVDATVFRRRHPAPANGTVAALGRYVEKKGFSYLIEATQLLVRSPEFGHAVIAGDGPLRPELEGQARALGIADRAVFPRAWGGDAVRELLEDCDVFALPAVIAADGDRDSMPVVVKEALAMEVPVVGTDHLGLPEMIKPEWGRLVPPGDPAALASAIAELLALSAAERAEMGRRGRAFVQDYCDVRTEARKLDVLLRETLELAHGG